jgi:archaellum component FlaF (FlaF/FlaG flagellin family)
MPITRKSLLEIRAAKQAELAERQAKLALQVEKVNKDLKVATKQVEVAARQAIEDDIGIFSKPAITLSV